MSFRQTVVKLGKYTSPFKPIKMPQTGQMLKLMQAQQLKKREKAMQKPAAHVHWVIAGNGGIGNSKSLYLFTSQNRYLFNCGETTQKVICEFGGHNQLNQLTNIFITQNTWHNIGN